MNIYLRVIGLNLFAALFFALLVAPTYGEEQSECKQRLESLLKEMGSQTSSYAGSVTYTNLMNQAKGCMESGRCGRSDIFIFFNEMILDQKVVQLQRQKIAVLKEMYRTIRSSGKENDHCYVVKLTENMYQKILQLNSQQIGRMNKLSKEHFDKLLPSK